MTGKNKIALPDTNIIIRYLLNDHVELSKQANDFFLLIEKGQHKAIILESVFTECVFILSKLYLVPKDKISSTLNSILQYKGIINDNKKILNSALALFSSTNLHIVDCILAANAKHMILNLLLLIKN